MSIAVDLDVKHQINKSFRNTIRVSNSLDPNQDQQNVGPDLGPNCSQRLSADDTSRQRVKSNQVRWIQVEGS